MDSEAGCITGEWIRHAATTRKRVRRAKQQRTALSDKYGKDGQGKDDSGHVPHNTMNKQVDALSLAQSRLER